MEYLSGFFLGAYPQLRNPDLVWRQDDRYRLATVATGTVMLNVSVITFGFEKYGVQERGRRTGGEREMDRERDRGREGDGQRERERERERDVCREAADM
ncbi:hypothetical protein T484DRAFT_2168980 [Baffinella frigidus]|nr:hypothetical protein T484DRAFT_2168980 [Cryptophyta sp. CCMP2293]